VQTIQQKKSMFFSTFFLNLSQRQELQATIAGRKNIFFLKYLKKPEETTSLNFRIRFIAYLRRNFREGI